MSLTKLKEQLTQIIRESGINTLTKVIAEIQQEYDIEDEIESVILRCIDGCRVKCYPNNSWVEYVIPNKPFDREDLKVLKKVLSYDKVNNEVILYSHITDELNKLYDENTQYGNVILSKSIVRKKVNDALGLENAKLIVHINPHKQNNEKET